jgi:hypothetical protein
MSKRLSWSQLARRAGKARARGQVSVAKCLRTRALRRRQEAWFSKVLPLGIFVALPFSNAGTDAALARMRRRA